MNKYTLLQRLLYGTAICLALLAAPAETLAVPKPITLLECLPGMTGPPCLIELAATDHPLDMFNKYARPFFPWLLAVAAGLTVLMVIIGGFQIMMSGGGENQRAGKDRIMIAIGGLMILIFSAAILAALNAYHFLLI